MEIIPTERSIYYGLELAGEIRHIGSTPIGAMTATPLIAHTDATEAALLDKLTPFAAQFPALPAVGESLEAGTIYRHNDTVVQVRQSHIRTTHAPSEVPALFIVVRANPDEILAWIAGESVEIGTIRDHEGVTYRAIQAHVTQPDWTPPATPALWETWTPPVQGQTWQDSGETVTSLIGAGVIGVSDTAPFSAGQSIRILGIEATVSSIFTPGVPGVLVISPHIGVSGGEMIEVFV